jgi:putative transposase
MIAVLASLFSALTGRPVDAERWADEVDRWQYSENPARPGEPSAYAWAALLREVFPQAREGRCWFHKTANVLAAPPKSAHPGAKKALAEIWDAEDKDHARAAVKAFEAGYGAKFRDGVLIERPEQAAA